MVPALTVTKAILLSILNAVPVGLVMFNVPNVKEAELPLRISTPVVLPVKCDRPFKLYWDPSALLN